jgi:basic membrane protein A
MASPTRSSSRRRRVAGILLVSALAASAATASGARVAFRACLATGPGAPGDLTSARLAAAGLRSAARSGISVRVVAGRSLRDEERSLRACVAWGAGLTIGVGYSSAPALDVVATAFPGRRFAALGVGVASLPRRPANVVGVVFRDEQAGYLAGYAAGLWAKDQHGKTVGAIGGLKIPPVDRFIAGFRFGAGRADHGLQTLVDYAGGFTGAADCRRRALAQIAHGSKVEFAVAGGCAAGVVAAAREHGVYAIDTGGDSANPWLMTSAREHADVAVRSLVAAAAAGRLQAGLTEVFGAARDGVGYGAWSPLVPASIRTAVARQERLLRAGRIVGIPTSLG